MMMMILAMNNKVPKQILNYKPERRRNVGRWFLGGGNRPSGLSLKDDNDDDIGYLETISIQDVV